MIVGVIGGNSVTSKEGAMARDVGRLLAEEGHTLVCGGLFGVMEESCRGAKEAGGTTVGILPGSDTKEANPYVTVPIATGMGVARNTLIIRTADVFIAIAGSYGTLTEIATALNLGKRVVSLKSWELDKLSGIDRSLFLSASTPEEAVRLALAP